MRKGIIILAGFLLLSQQILLAEDAALNVKLSNSRDDLILYVSATGAFNEKTTKAILSGVPTTFIFHIVLSENRNYWFNKSIVKLKVTHIIEYDNLKQEFHVERSWDSGGPIVTVSFEEAQQLMIKVDSLKIISLEKMEKGRHEYVL